MNSILAAMVNGAILSAAVTAAEWLALGLMPRRGLNAATRYAVWWAALAARSRSIAVSFQLSAVSIRRRPRRRRRLVRMPSRPLRRAEISIFWSLRVSGS